MYHFISGYTAKVAGTEMGVKDPEATFSACFGAAFMVWHPTKYAELLADKIAKNGSQAWLVNTGWSGGGHGTGKRMSLKYTRAILDAIHDGSLAKAKTVVDPVFGLHVPTACATCPAEILIPGTRGPTRPPTTRRPSCSPACSPRTSASTPTAPARRSATPARRPEPTGDGSAGRPWPAPRRQLASR
jgi:hypothetical protein